MKHEKLKNVKAHIQYKLADGTRVPGTTTVLGILSKPALIHWAWDLGMRQIDYKKYRDVLADIGTLAHLLVLNRHLGGGEVDLSPYSSEQIDKAENGLLKYYEWEKKHTVEPVIIEEPMVSELHRYGGTIDCLARVDGVLTLLDIKTGKGIYAEFGHQLAAYLSLLLEHGHDPKQAMILRLGRSEDEGFEVKEYGMKELEAHWELFKACLKIYGLRKQIA